jgi:hypothetical protein
MFPTLCARKFHDPCTMLHCSAIKDGQPDRYKNKQANEQTNTQTTSHSTARLMMDNLIDPREVFERLDPATLAQEMEPVLRPVLDHILRQTFAHHTPRGRLCKCFGDIHMCSYSMLLLTEFECSCYVHSCSLHSDHANLTAIMQLHFYL